MLFYILEKPINNFIKKDKQKEKTQYEDSKPLLFLG